jgi:large subunit ribosomal protein L4
MKLEVKGGGSVEVSDAAFDARFNEALIHQVVTAYRAGGRAGTKAQKTRAEVSGGGKKPWKQKGSGRARAGSSRSPIWVGGGRAFAAKPRDYDQKVNRKMYRAAMRSVISELVRQGRLDVVDSLDVPQPRTRELASRLREFSARRLLILVEQLADNLRLAARNIPNVLVLEAREANPLVLVQCDRVLATAGALKIVEERLA